MAELNFSTGVERFAVNGGYEIAFNPTDAAFVEKVFNAFDALDQKQEAWENALKEAASNKEAFEVCRNMDTEMRGMIDSIFLEPVCDFIFGGVNVFALADGLPLWCNFLFAIMDLTDSAFAREQKAMNPRIKKYTAKYHK